MGVTFDYKGALDGAREEFDKIVKDSPRIEESIVKRMAETVAGACRRRLGYDTGKRSGHKGRVHMADDVVVSRSTRREGDLIRVVGGGKKTGTLWHLVEYGTDRNNRNGKHFIERSLEDTEGETDKIFDEEIRRGLNIE